MCDTLDPPGPGGALRAPPNKRVRSLPFYMHHAFSAYPPYVLGER